MSIPLPLVGPDYADETASFGSESTINLIPERAGSQGTVARYILRTHGGLTSFVTGLSGAIRGEHEMGGVFYVVSAEVLYSVDSGGVATNLGAILGSGRCMLADNFIPATRRQLVIFTGERGYVYDTLSGLVEITDPDFTDVAVPTTPIFIDSYILAPTEDGFIWSLVTDATSWEALSFKTAEAAPDAVVALAAVYGDAWVFGGRTIEVFRTTADPDDAFQKVQVIEKGCGAKYSPVTFDNGVAWIDQTGRVWKANGFSPVRISDHSVEQYLASVDYSQAFGFTYVDRGHEFYGFTVPEGKTFLYDVATGLWHRRKSEGVDRWRISSQALCYGVNLFGDYSTGMVWRLDTSAISEGTGRMSRERITGYLYSNGDPLFHSTLDVYADTGNALQTGNPEQTAPVLEMRYSDDRGRNWSNWKSVSIGLIGEYAKRLRWTQLGRTRQRVFHFRITDPVRCDLISMSAVITKGRQS